MDGFDKLFSRWIDGRYGEPFYALCEIIALITGFLWIKNYKIGKLFLFYICFDFSILLLDFYIQDFAATSNAERNNFFSLTNGFISWVEISVYYYFFYVMLTSMQVKRYILTAYSIFNALFLLFIMTYLGPRVNMSSISDLLGTVEFILLMPPCFAYYLQLFNPPMINLFQRPSFWITTGIFFYAIVSIPYYLLHNILFLDNYPHYRKITSLLFDVPFGINFLFLTRAFLCRRQLTT